MLSNLTSLIFFFLRAPFLALSLEMSITPSTSSPSAVCVILDLGLFNYPVFSYPAILSRRLRLSFLHQVIMARF